MAMALVSSLSDSRHATLLPPRESRKITFLAIEDVDGNAAAACFVDDDAGIGIQVFFEFRSDEQRLVIGVLVLDGEYLNGLEAELVIKRLGLGVAVNHRQIHVRPPGCLEMLRECADQGLADTGEQSDGIDRQAPQAGAIVRIVEDGLVIDAGHCADHLTTVGVDCDQVDDLFGITLAPDEIGIGWHHVALEIKIVDGLGFGLLLDAADLDGPIGHLGVEVGQIEAQHVRGIQEQLLRCIGQHDVRLGDIGGDITLARSLLDHLGGDLAWILERLSKDDPSPATVQGHLVTHDASPRSRPHDPQMP